MEDYNVIGRENGIEVQTYILSMSKNRVIAINHRMSLPLTMEQAKSTIGLLQKAVEFAEEQDNERTI